MHARWKDFLKEFPRKPVEYHRDEFLKEFPTISISFPAILVRFGDGPPRVLITSVGLGTVSEIDDLIEMVRSRLSEAQAKNLRAA